MKRYIKFVLLTVFAFSALGLLFAQTTPGPDPAYKAVYQNPKIKEAIDFMKYELPELVRTNPQQAAVEYEKHFSNLNKLEEQDVLFLVGHFYAVSDDALTALKYFLQLSKHPQLGENARRMINLLLYQRTIANMLGSNKEAAKLFLQDVMNLFDTDKYYPIYLYMWADLVSETDDSYKISDYIDNYRINQAWLETQFRPRENAILNRLEQLNTEAYFQNPTQAGYDNLAKNIDGIWEDLETLYAEARTIKGLVMMETLEQVQREESRLLTEYKGFLRELLNTRDITIDAFLDPNSPVAKNEALAKYREPVLYLASAREYQRLLAKTIDTMDRIFETKYQQFATEDPSIMGKDFSDMELKRLIDIEKNIRLYDTLIQTYEEVMASPEYKAQTAVDYSAQLKEYKEKRQDLKIRKDRYLAMRKHGTDAEELVFNQFYEEYLSLQDYSAEYSVVVDGFERSLLATIMLQYPDELKRLAQNSMDELKSQNVAGKLESQVAMIAANLDYISLQNRYRQLHARDAKRRANTSLTLEQTTREYENIIADKKKLLNDYNAFLTQNPGFRTFITPADIVPQQGTPEYDGKYDYLISSADIYYNMAELQWATDLDNPSKALALYHRVLQENPDFYLKDYALYNIAFIGGEINLAEKELAIDNWRMLNPNKQRGAAQRLSENDFAESIANYRQILDTYPDSPLYDEAVYRLANLYFLVGTDADRPIEWYAQANSLFDRLIAKPQSPYHYEAMFQRGFVNLNISDETSLNGALMDFATILNAANSGLIQPADTAQDFKNNSLDQIAYCLVALDGADFTGKSRGLQALAASLGELKDETILNRILDKASENKKEMRLTRQSIDFLELRLQKIPNSLANPSLVDSILVLFHGSDTTLRPGESLVDIRRDWYRYSVDHFGKNSPWYAENVKGKNIEAHELAMQLASIRNAYRQVQIVLYEAARVQLTEQALKAYLDHTAEFAAYEEMFAAPVYTAYAALLQKYFKTKPAAYDTDYAKWTQNSAKEELILAGNLADKLQTDESYRKIYDMLVAYNEKYLTAGSAEAFDNEELAFSYAIRRNELLKSKLEGAELDELHKYYEDATNRFVNALKNQGTDDAIRQANQLVLDLAHMEFNETRYKAAETRYLGILENNSHLSNSDKYDIYYNLAFIAESDTSLPAATRFQKSEQYARQALSFTTDSAKLANAHQMIKLQIQNSYTAAQEGNDHVAAAENLGRMAQEFPYDKYPAEHLNYIRLQAEQYELGKQYDKLIDSYMYLASKEKPTDVEAIYGLYYLSWNVADKQLKDNARAEAIKGAFMQKYPGSNQTYRLRTVALESKAANPDTRLAAAEEYIALSEEVRTGKINAGDVKPENIYMQAYNIYNEDQKSAKRLEVLDVFINRYPNNPDVTGMLRTIASGYYVLEDNDKFEIYAKRLFDRDKKEFDLYQGVAVKYLSRVLVEYDNAYLNKDWTLAFKKRDEFKALEAKYRKEGLPLDTTVQYKSFAAAETEYKEIQAVQAFLKNFDSQLGAIERGEFLRQTPNQHVTINANTSFKGNLLGGKTRRLPNFASALSAEVKKVERLISPENQLKLDTPRIVKALALEARIYEYGITVVTAQINQFMNITNEFRPFKNDENAQASIWGQINNDYIYPFEDSANGIYASLVSTFYLAGYEDANTRLAVNKLNERSVMPDYQKQEYLLNGDWTLNWIDSADKVKAANPVFKTITTPRGQNLGELQIPPNTKLQAELKLNSKVAPSLVFVQMVYPYDPEAFVNGEKVEFSGFAVDSLDVKQPMTARFGYSLRGAKWDAKSNSIKLLFPNRYDETIPVRAAVQVYYDKALVEQAKPRETVKFASSPSWKVIVKNPETKQETAILSRAATSFAIPQDAINGLSGSNAQAIWVMETPEAPLNNVTFETDINIDSQPVSAMIEFIAPENASVYVNGTLVAQDQELYMDTDPIAVYTNIVDIPLDMLKTGKNTIRIEVQNQTAYRGMLAEIKIEKYAKE